jgi:hypothetical protein
LALPFTALTRREGLLTRHDDRVAADEQPNARWKLLTAAGYWLLSVLFLAAALVTAVLPIEFNDTSTSVLNGFHRYLTKPYAGSVRWGFGAMLALLFLSAACSVLAARATGERSARSLGTRGVVSMLVVLAVLVGLWFVAPASFPGSGG